MKKIIAVLFVVLLLCVSGCDTVTPGADVPASSSSTTTTTTTMTTTTTSATATNTQAALPESLVEKLTREIEGAYIEEQKLPESSTTLGMIELSARYTEKWKEVADEYYQKIMAYDDVELVEAYNYSADDLHTFVSNMKTNWEQYNQTACENYRKVLQTQYGLGSIVGPIFAEYQYEKQKEWALELVGIYQQFHVDE